MEKKIEAVARAIWTMYGESFPHRTYDDLPLHKVNAIKAYAKAAVEAITSPAQEANTMQSEEVVEKVAKALALEMYPDTRWPRDEADADYGAGDSEHRHPVSWHYAQTCRRQAKVAIAALSTDAELVAGLVEVVEAMARFDGRNNNSHLKQMAKDAIAAYRSALSAQVQDVAIPEGWHVVSPEYHRHPYQVTEFMGEWHLSFHYPNGSCRVVSKHKTAEEAMAAAPAAKQGETDTEDDAEIRSYERLQHKINAKDGNI